MNGIPKLADAATTAGKTARKKAILEIYQLSDKSSSTTPPTMPLICSVEFVNQLVHCTATKKKEKY